MNWTELITLQTSSEWLLSPATFSPWLRFTFLNFDYPRRIEMAQFNEDYDLNKPQGIILTLERQIVYLPCPASFVQRFIGVRSNPFYGTCEILIEHDPSSVNGVIVPYAYLDQYPYYQPPKPVEPTPAATGPTQNDTWMFGSLAAVTMFDFN